MLKKYELLTDDTIVLPNGKTGYRIRRLSDQVLGGYIESEKNLSHFGDCWVYGNAQVFGDAWVYGDAWVCGDAWVYGDAWIYGDTRVYGNARVFGNAQVFGDARVSGDARIQSPEEIMWFTGVGSEYSTLTAFKTTDGYVVTRGCFIGTIDQFDNAVKQKHGDNEFAREYLLLSQVIKQRFEHAMSR